MSFLFFHSHCCMFKSTFAILLLEVLQSFSIWLLFLNLLILLVRRLKCLLNGTPLQYSCLGNPTDGGAWKAAVHGVAIGPDTTGWLHFHFSLSCTGEGNGNPLQCSCLENPRDGGAWWAAVYGVAQSQTRLKWLSSSSSRFFKLQD